MTALAPEGLVNSLFPGDGEMARLCRSTDWASTSLGPVEEWSPALRVVVRMTIECPFPIILWCGPDLLQIYNDANRPFLGVKHPLALGRAGKESWPEIWPEIAPLLETIRMNGPATYAEDARFVMEREKGSPRDAWFTFSLSPVRDEDGTVVAVLSVAWETTQRIRAERLVQDALLDAERAEQQLRDVFAQAPAFLAVVRGPDHVFEFANDAYMQLVGHRDLVGKRVVEALPEVRGQGFIQLLDEVLITGKPFIGREVPVMLERVRGAPPEQVFVDFVYQRLADPAGGRVGIVAHGSDVTANVLARREVERLWHESENANAAVLASEQRFRFLTNAIPVQVWTATPDGALDFVSDRVGEYFGKTVAEVIGDGWLAVLHPDDVKGTIDRWRASLETGAPYEVEFRLWSAEHQAFRWHLGRATPQRDEGGAIIRWFGTNTEIEDRKQTEADLRRLTAEATEADRAKASFLAAMSHELRTPLNAIGGYAQLIEMGVRGPVSDEQRIDLLKIQRSKDHLDALVSDVLNFAKQGSGKVEYTIEPVDVHSTLQGVLEMVAPQLSAKELRVAPFTTPRGLTAMADGDKMRQILINLLGNALKFTPPAGTLSLSINATKTEVAISVIDTGIGIPEDQVDKIFEPFVQAGSALDKKDQGVGLGLAISRQLARAMRGDLRVVSTVGKGSTFTLTLPRR